MFLRLTKGLLAVQDVEVIMHAGSQQKVLLGWMPLQSPDSTTKRALTEGLTHAPAVPQQHLLIIALAGKFGH